MNHIPSPDTSDAGIERLIQAKGKTAPRITPADIEANIIDTEIIKHVSFGGQVLRWAVITTRNGFAVVGRPSVSVSPENDDGEIGVAVAISNTKNELWPLMGYELRTKLSEPAAPTKPRYTFADIENLITQENIRDNTMSFRVSMRDGATFEGSVPFDTEERMRDTILAKCNAPCEARR